MSKRNTNNYILQVITANNNKILVDYEDFEKISKYSWCVSKTGYAVANINGKVTKMHRYILGITNPEIVIDHINHNTLDNRKNNLRICTNKENSRNAKIGKNNKTGFIGISIAYNGKYRARIMVDRKEIALGHYTNIEDAIAAREKAEKLYFKEFAPSISRNIEEV